MNAVRRHQPRFGAQATRRSRRATPLAAFVVLLMFLAPMASVAQDTTPKNADLWAAIDDVLSASAWLYATGQDPRYQDLAMHAAPWNLDPGDEEVLPEPPEGSAPAFLPNQIVSHSMGSIAVSSEPSIAVHPSDPDHIVLGVSALDLPSVAIYVSFDGGDSWQGPTQVPQFHHDAGSIGGPLVAFDRGGTVYVVSRSIGDDEDSFSSRSRIAVSTSNDGGLTWNEPVSAVTSRGPGTNREDGTGQITASFLDTPSVAIGPDPQDPDRDIVAIAYTEFTVSFAATAAEQPLTRSDLRTESTIRLIRSSDGGETWSDPIAVSPTVSRTRQGIMRLSLSPDQALAPDAQEPAAPTAAPAGNDGDQVVQGSATAVTSDGSIVVSYFDSTRDGPQQGLGRVMAAISEDGGRTFGEPAQAGLFREIGARPRTAFFRWWGSSFPKLAVGPDDELYVAVAVSSGSRPGDESDIVVFRSRDQGAAWSAAMPVGREVDTSGAFFPAIAAGPDGALHAAWAAISDDPAKVSYDIRLSESDDQGETWRVLDQDAADVPFIRVSSVSSNSLIGFPGGRYLGDRLALALAGDNAYLAWPDTRLAEPDALNQQVAFARYEPKAAP